MAAAPSKSGGGEHNFVADAHNWEQRIKVENSASQIWSNNWGTLYAAQLPHTYEDKIKALEKELKAIPVASMATNTMLSYLGDQPFDEIKTVNYGKKTFGKFEAINTGFKEALDPKYKPSGDGFGR